LTALDGKKFGDTPFALPAVTSPGAQAVSYEASGACSVVGMTVTITSAGDCVIEASAAGTNTEDDPEAGVWYRPFALIQTAPVAPLGQYLSGMPALNALKVGAMSAALPTLTVQE